MGPFVWDIRIWKEMHWCFECEHIEERFWKQLSCITRRWVAQQAAARQFTVDNIQPVYKILEADDRFTLDEIVAHIPPVECG